MKTKIIVIATTLLVLNLACDEKKPITQELCERQTNQADCESAGCTVACGMILMSDNSNACLARRQVGRCLAVVKFVGKDDDTNNGDINHTIHRDETVWTVDSPPLNGYYSWFRIRNPFPYTVEVLGHRLGMMSQESFNGDPCIFYDPDGAPSVPWEGSCETDWWSEDMWDDILPE